MGTVRIVHYQFGGQWNPLNWHMKIKFKVQYHANVLLTTLKKSEKLFKQLSISTVFQVFRFNMTCHIDGCGKFLPAFCVESLQNLTEKET